MSEGISEGLKDHETAPGNPLADSTLPDVPESLTQALQDVEQMEVDVKNQQNNSEETRAATDQPSSFCPNGYQKYREVCYKAFETSRNFHESAATCVAHGGTLAMPRDAGTNTFLISLISDAGLFANYWFGLHDQREHGTWEWIDGTPLGTGYSMWAEGQPSDNVTGFQHCGMYWWVKQYRWNDYGCFGHNNFICQIVPSGSYRKLVLDSVNVLMDQTTTFLQCCFNFCMCQFLNKPFI
ncbi:C-type lectin mannose-binding isoform-like [Branchiostoma lanceolatum]|uniref:C-type lectin mannose-binding isoform-like n=1 Tax=Branchiostoma lanceolatum TaxID=7740 RepID=UPI0034556C6A